MTTTNLISAPMPSLTISEIESRMAEGNSQLPAVFLYTEECYAETNSTLRGGDVPFLAKLMDKELASLTPSKGVYLRGTNKQAFLDHCIEKDGKTIYSDLGYMSSTKDVHVVRNFVLSNSVLLVIEGSPYDIAKYSAYQEEGEFLFPHGSTFEVLYMDNNVPDNMWGPYITPHPVDVYHIRQI